MYTNHYRESTHWEITSSLRVLGLASWIKFEPNKIQQEDKHVSRLYSLVLTIIECFLFVTCSGKLWNKLHGQVSPFTCVWNQQNRQFRVTDNHLKQMLCSMCQVPNIVRSEVDHSKFGSTLLVIFILATVTLVPATCSLIGSSRSYLWIKISLKTQAVHVSWGRIVKIKFWVLSQNCLFLQESF